MDFVVFFFCREHHFSTGKCSASNEYVDYNFSIKGTLRPNGETCYDAFSLMGVVEENSSGFDSRIVKEGGEGDDSDISKVEEDVEVRMDLTDDLLHMVIHVEKCKKIVFFLCCFFLSEFSLL